MNKYIQKIHQFFISFLKDPLFLTRWEQGYSRYSSERENRLSARVTAHNRGNRYAYNGDSSLFIENLYAGIVPFMIYRGESEKYPVKIAPDSPEKKRMISDAIFDRGHRTSLENAFCDFVRSTAQTLLQDGEVFYEIVYTKKESGEIESFSLDHIQPYYLFRLFKNYYQIIPWWEARKLHTRVQIVKIPVEKIMRIDFPKKLCSKFNLKRMLKRIWKLGREIIPEFQMKSMENNQNIGFDLNEFSKAKYLEVAKITKKFGWNQNQKSDNFISEYYAMERFLREKNAEAIIRNHIIYKLNQTLNGPLLNLATAISMENIFSVKEVEEQRKKLREGNVAFMDIFNSLKV